MTTAAIVLAAVLAVAAVLWVARPLLARDEGGEETVPDEAAAERLRLLEARDRALTALKELEFDHRTGKISDTDYAELVGPLRADAAEALAALDARTKHGDSGVSFEAALPAEGKGGEEEREEPASNGTAARRQERPR
jgi:hypothetical protein